jgi:hypothetical protein
MKHVVALVIACTTLSGCIFMLPGDGGVHASGVVRDSEGTPIAGAAINLQAGSSVSDKTGTDGRFLVGDVVAPGRYNVPLLISASGFKSVEVSVPTLTNNHVVAVLERLESVRESQVSVHTLASAPAQ